MKFRLINAMVLSAALSGNVWADLNDGLVAYYPFDGNAQDESGNGNDGTVDGATLTEDRFGNKGSAYNFDGVNDFISIDDGSQFNFSNNFSLSLWVKPGVSQNNSYAGLIDKSHSHNSNNGVVKSWILQQNDRMTNNFSFSYCSNNSCVGTKNPISLDANIWNNLFISKANKVVKVYKNGILISTYQNSVSSIDTNATLPLIIGSVNNLNRFFNGLIDDIRIYNRALSESEIQQLYHGCQPSIDIILNNNNRIIGDKLVINSHIKVPDNSDSSCEPTKIVETIWAKLPNDSIISLVKPFTELTLLPGKDIDKKIFQYTFRGADPIGSYQIGGRLLHPITGNTISNDIETLTLSK